MAQRAFRIYCVMELRRHTADLFVLDVPDLPILSRIIWTMRMLQEASDASQEANRRRWSPLTSIQLSTEDSTQHHAPK